MVVNAIKLHPVTVILYILILFFIVLAFNNPAAVVMLTVLSALNLAASRNNPGGKKVLAGSFCTGLFIFLINPLVSRSGLTVLLSFTLPVVGKMDLTLESVLFGFVMGCKVIAVTLLFFLYSSLTDTDDTFSFFSRYAHKLTLTFSMTLNILHRLSLDIVRIKDVMVMRGADFNQRNLFKKARAYSPLLKVLLISALEGSLDRAEALYSKGYGRCKRTSYSRLYFSRMDYAFIFICVIQTVIFAAGILGKHGSYSFYPLLDGLTYGDAVFCGLLGIPAAAGAFIIWRCRRWKYSK